MSSRLLFFLNDKSHASVYSIKNGMYLFLKRNCGSEHCGRNSEIEVANIARIMEEDQCDEELNSQKR